MLHKTIWIISILALAAGCSTTSPVRSKPAFEQVGLASYYAARFQGRKTASGERYDRSKYTAAHKHLPFGSVVEVKNLKNGRSIKVRINDRGPFVRGRIIDLSYAAAQRLGMLRDGVVKVKIVHHP